MTVRVGTCMIVQDRSGRVLWQHRAAGRFAGLWLFPGGRIEHGETAADGAVREVLEEEGVVIRPDSVRLVGVVAHEGDLIEDWWITTVFIGCSVDTGSAREFVDSVWSSTAPGPLMAATALAYELWREEGLGRVK